MLTCNTGVKCQKEDTKFDGRRHWPLSHYEPEATANKAVCPHRFDFTKHDEVSHAADDNGREKCNNIYSTLRGFIHQEMSLHFNLRINPCPESVFINFPRNMCGDIFVIHISFSLTRYSKDSFAFWIIEFQKEKMLSFFFSE